MADTQTLLDILVARSKGRGFLTFDEVNETLPPDLLSSEEIEGILRRLHALNVEIAEHE